MPAKPELPVVGRWTIDLEGQVLRRDDGVKVPIDRHFQATTVRMTEETAPKGLPPRDEMANAPLYTDIAQTALAALAEYRRAPGSYNRYAVHCVGGEAKRVDRTIYVVAQVGFEAIELASRYQDGFADFRVGGIETRGLDGPARLDKDGPTAMDITHQCGE